MLSVPVWILAGTLVCALVPTVVCVAAGAAIGRGRSRWPGADLLVGFGLAGCVFIVLAVTTRLPLSRLMLGIAIVAALAPLIRRQWPGGRSTTIAFALIAPILVVAATGGAAMWDDFWNWLPSAAYEYVHDSLPWPDLPASMSLFPGYPQGMPLMIAAASFVSGRFLEAAGPVTNVALLAGSSAVLAEAVAAALVRRGRLAVTETPLFLIAAAVAITTLLNPGLDGAVLLCAYADVGTMVAVGALALLGVEILARLASKEAADVEALAWRFGFVGAMLISLKQANPALLALLMGGLVLIALREPALRTRRALLQLPRMLGPALLLFAVWRGYLRQAPSNAEQTFQPFSAWNFGELANIFNSMGHVIADAPLFHAVMWLVTAAGVAAFFGLPRKSSEARWLAVICAAVWLGYNAFLLIIYLGVMSDTDARMAADYWRYTPHVALLALYPPAMALALAPWPKWLDLRSAAVAAAAVVLALCALPARADLNNPRGREWQRFIRDAATDISRMIPPHAKLLIVPVTNVSPYGVAARYNLWHLDKPGQQIDSTILWLPDDYPKVASWAARGEADYLLVQDAEGVMDAATSALGLPRLDHELVLYGWRDGAWAKLKSWPVPPALIYRE